MTPMADTPAALQMAGREAAKQLEDVDRGAHEQMAMARAYPAGRMMALGGLMPTTLEDGVKLANLLAKSALIPKDMRERPADVLAAIMLGADVGLPPMQALQSIAVINGRPSMWGDGMLAVVMNHPAFEDIAESFDQNVDGGTATCQVWRKGRRQPTVSTFSHADAQRAGLLSKDTYKNYERRMLKMRARSWALRDAFPDAIRGILPAEEAQDLPGELLTSEVVERPQPIQMPARLSAAEPQPEPIAHTQTTQSATTTTVPTPTTSGAADAEELPAAADRLTDVKKHGPSKNGAFWWTVETERGVKAYTWSTTIGGQLETFFMDRTAIDLDTEKDTRGDHKIIQVQKFDVFGGAGLDEPGAQG